MAQGKPRSELSMGLRLLILLGMTLLLLIPQALISLLVSDRSDVAELATQSIVNPWGQGQTVQGPMLAVPYHVSFIDGTSKVTEQRIAFIQPDSVAISVHMVPEVRYRSIFPVLLYKAQVTIAGAFTSLEQVEFPSNAFRIAWQDARIVHHISDLVGLKSVPRVRFSDSLISLASGTLFGLPKRFPLLSGSFPVEAYRPYDFTYEYAINGSSELSFAPCSGITHVDLSLAWGKPSFVGKFLPDDRQVADTLSRASWTILGVNTSRAQAWTYSPGEYFDEDSFDEPDERFGVKALLGLSHYDMVSRSVRFGVLMIVFTFLTFFFTDSLMHRPIPMIGYVLTGVAIMLFYTLLLSISEYTSFGVAFFLSGGGITLMISLYLYGFVRQMRPALLCAGILLILYTFLYIILQMESFPLLVGSIFLFLVLGVVMYLSQRLDW